MSCVKKINGYEVKDEIARKEIEVLKNRKFIFIGDSYGTYYTKNSVEITPWTTFIKQYLGLDDSRYFMSSKSGSGFCSGTSFLSLLSTLGETISDKESITDVVVCGGYNDNGFEQSAIEDAIRDFASYVKQTYPNAIFRVGHIGWSYNYNLCLPLATKTIPAYRNVVRYGGVYLNNVEYSNHNYNNYSDSFHPDTEGQKTIATAIANAILTGSCNIFIPQLSHDVGECMMTGGNSFTSTNKAPIKSTMNNNRATLYSTGLLTLSFDKQKLNRNYDFKIYKIPVSGCVRGFTSMENVIHVNVLATNGTNDYTIQATLKLFCDENGDTYLVLNLFSLDAQSWELTKIIIPQFAIHCDSLLS